MTDKGKKKRSFGKKNVSDKSSNNELSSNDAPTKGPLSPRMLLKKNRKTKPSTKTEVNPGRVSTTPQEERKSKSKEKEKEPSKKENEKDKKQKGKEKDTDKDKEREKEKVRRKRKTKTPEISSTVKIPPPADKTETKEKKTETQPETEKKERSKRKNTKKQKEEPSKKQKTEKSGKKKITTKKSKKKKSKPKDVDQPQSPSGEGTSSESGIITDSPNIAQDEEELIIDDYKPASAGIKRQRRRSEYGNRSFVSAMEKLSATRKEPPITEQIIETAMKGGTLRTKRSETAHTQFRTGTLRTPKNMSRFQIQQASAPLLNIPASVQERRVQKAPSQGALAGMLAERRKAVHGEDQKKAVEKV